MITREILEAQINLYQQGRAEALATSEKARADVNAFNGAIEACENMLRIIDGFKPTVGASQESSSFDVEELGAGVPKE